MVAVVVVAGGSPRTLPRRRTSPGQRWLYNIARCVYGVLFNLGVLGRGIVPMYVSVHAGVRTLALFAVPDEARAVNAEQVQQVRPIAAAVAGHAPIPNRSQAGALLTPPARKLA